MPRLVLVSLVALLALGGCCGGGDYLLATTEARPATLAKASASAKATANLMPAADAQTAR